MDYVGIDPTVGLECSGCKHVNRMSYSDLLSLLVANKKALCSSCERPMLHDWTTVDVVQDIIKKRMDQANELKAQKRRAG